MTKSFHLHKNADDWWYKVEIKVLAICSGFVKKCYGSTPDKITVTLYTEEIENATKIFVQKHGFYRWEWFSPDWKKSGGMYGYAEDQLNKLFPDAKEDGFDKPKELWIKFTK
jgi:hypothetical protein